MKLSFNIKYRTNWGESVYLTGDIAALGSGDYAKAVKLNFNGIDDWSIDINLDDITSSFSYNYIVIHEEGSIKEECGHPHVFTPSVGTDSYAIYDRWHDRPFDKPYYSAAFTECFCRHEESKVAKPAIGFITVNIVAPLISSGNVLAICGEAESIGAWDPKKAIIMSANAPYWSVNIPVSGLSADTLYKFVVLNETTHDIVAWEGGENRRLGVNVNSDTASIISGLHFINPASPWRGAGTAIPVFSLRSKNDFGVGDFYDLIPLIDWAVSTGQKFIQLLPINDTTMSHSWTDSYPYNANSIFALHPMYLRLEEIGVLKDKKRRKYYADLAAELNVLDKVDYERVNQGKIEYFREIFAQDGSTTLASEEYKAFAKANEHWLKPYAAFCTLRDKFGTADYTQWGKYAKFSGATLKKVIAENKTEIDYVCYLQYHLDKQMTYVHEYAKAHGVALKGDVAIGISRTSADAWQDPRLFNLDCQAGAPPDDFSVTGQNWGFPTYNWQEMSLDGFAWWKARLGKMASYFDAYRIDHVLGFFRIWQIPMNSLHGLLGYFNPAIPYSIDELQKDFDFVFDANLYTKPFIRDYFIEDFFGEYTKSAISKYLRKTGKGAYVLKNEFNTQRKIADYFATQEDTDENRRICEGLLNLADEVLFIEDPIEKGKYHPRIAGQYTYIYRSLSEYERWCFNRLYDEFYFNRHNKFWYEKGMWKLPPLIDCTKMLACAEDLGMIPSCVPAVINKLEILSLEIQRMPKAFGAVFGDTYTYPYHSICTTSTHDMSGIRLWWEEDRGLSQRFYNEVMHENGSAPYFAEPWICERIVDMHLQSPSMLCILPLQDWLSLDASLRRKDPHDEVINVPANPHHYWRYRMHLSIEQLQASTDFNNFIKEKIKNSNR